ncbi:hypothetical protein LPJ75_002310 [Coemansia sp. RSA 2598]|nr:hypothetical protein LPJ75_002310 [Coemansia sp. RSA 2598]
MAKKRSPMSRAVSFVGSAFVRLFGDRVTDEHVLVNMVHVRHHLQPLAGFYFGNPVLIHPMSMSTTPAANTDARSSFVRQALAISEELRGIDGPSARGFVDMVCADPSAHARFATFAFTAPSILTVVDERSYRMDGVDFGNGGPVWISGIPIHMPNVVALLQQPAPMHGGVAIFASLEPGIAELIASDPFFNQFSSTM